MINSSDKLANEPSRHLINDINHLIKASKLEEIALSGNKQRPDLSYSILHNQQTQRIRRRLNKTHPADIAELLELLPKKHRLYIWEQIDQNKSGEVLLNLSDAIRESIVSSIHDDKILSVTEKLDSDEIADLAPSLPPKIVNKILKKLNAQNRQQLESALSFDEHKVGALMDFNMITIREDISIKGILRYCQKLGHLPEQTNQMFVVDRNNILKGALPLQTLIATSGDTLVGTVMNKNIVAFTPDSNADKAAQAFDRYELITAPIINEHNELIGRLSVDNIINYNRQQIDDERLNLAGLSEDEDRFSGIWKGAKNRWFWLAMNLCTAFLATRIISLFEETIIQLVALATLMPVIAAVGGNTGNQTSMIIIRSLALDQIKSSNIHQLVYKEVCISIINGIVWGIIMALFVYLIYQNINLAIVMMTAIILNLLLSTLSGIAVPLIRSHYQLDPAMGTSVILTFIADSAGFFIFLGLATLFL